MLCANPLVKEMHKVETRCQSLLEKTAEALDEDVLALMLLAVQKADLGLSISTAVNCVHHMSQEEDMWNVIFACLETFPQIWFDGYKDELLMYSVSRSSSRVVVT